MSTRAFAALFAMASWTLIGCATQSTTTQSTAPDTEKQGKVRSDLGQCNTAAGDKAHSIAVSPEGKYSFQVTGTPYADRILACMASKGYSGVRLDNAMDHGAKEMIRSGGEGQARN
jgi:hypothetical protein